MIRILTEWDEPEEWIVAENSAEVLAESTIIWPLRMESVFILTALLAEFDSRELIADQVYVEREEGRDYKCKDNRQDPGCHDEVGVLVVETLRVVDCP